MSTVTLSWRELQFPTDLGLDQVMVFTRLLAMRPLHGLFRQPDPIVCEVVSTPAELRWQLGMTGREAGMLLPQLRTQLPGLSAERVDGQGLPALEWAIELRLDNKTRPLRTDVAETVAASLLTALGGVYGNEALVLSWVIGPWLARPAVQRGERLGTFDAPLESEEATALRAKLAEPVLGVVGRIGVRADTPARQSQLVQRVLGALELTRAAGVGFVVRYVSAHKAADRLARHQGPLFDWPCPLNAAELATVLGWPIGNPYLDRVAYRGHRQLPAAAGNWVSDATAKTAPAGRYRVLGRSTFPGRGGLVHLPAADALHHLHIVGPTGTGKSVLLAHLIEADIHAGRSVVVIEPKADLIAAVLDRIPPNRTDDVVLINPADPHFAVGVNLLAGPNPELAADRFVDVIHNLHRDSWGPRTSQVLHAAALTLARADQTLAELPHLLSDAGYRERVLSRVPDPLGTGPFWAWFNALSDAERTAVIGPSLNRLGAFLGRPAIRAMIGQTQPRFALNQVFTNRPVLLVNLARGLIGPESARLLGALLLSQLWQAALARAAIPAERRHIVPVFIDEFHEYTAGLPLDLGDVLSQARGLHVALTVAHQGLHQLDPTTRAGVMANARSRLVFQTTGRETDLRALAASLGGGITPTDLAALGAWEAYAALVHDHAPNPPASLATLPPAPSLGTADAVRDRSRAQWATPTADVDAAILSRRQPAPHQASPAGRRRRTPT